MGSENPLINLVTNQLIDRLGFFLDFTAQQNLRFVDQIDRNLLLRYVKFLREHDIDLDDRTVHNIFETLNTFLRTRDVLIAGKILAELDYAEKPPKPYTKQEFKDMFAAMDDEEKLLYGLFLNHRKIKTVVANGIDQQHCAELDSRVRTPTSGARQMVFERDVVWHPAARCQFIFPPKFTWIRNRNSKTLLEC